MAVIPFKEKGITRRMNYVETRTLKYFRVIFPYFASILLIGILLTTGASSSQAQTIPSQKTQTQAIPTQGDLPNLVFMTSGNIMHEMPLKALNANGEVSKVPGFTIAMTKIALVNPSSPTINAFSSDSSLTITGAKLRLDKEGFDLPRTGNTYSVAGFAQGVYTLDVIAQKGNNQAAYETILVIGPTISPQIQNVIQQRILQETRVDVDTDIVFKNPKQHKPNDKDIVCLYDPGNSLCNPDSSGNCPSGWGTNEDGQCFPTDKDCPEGYWRADDDETGACVPKGDSEFDKSELPPCDGSLQDCVTENGDVCEAGSTDHECELDEEESAYFVDEPVEEEDATESDDGDDSTFDDDEGSDSDEDVETEDIEAVGEESFQE